MGLTKEKRENLRQYIINNITKHPQVIARMAGEEFKITRQAVCRYIKKLKAENIIEAAGKGRGTKYALKTTTQLFQMQVQPNLSEDAVWREKILPVLPKLAKNIMDVCHYGFTEMFNNVVDHSESNDVVFSVEDNALEIVFYISDSGVGIFNKIKKALNLEDPQHAVLELAKGKLTTDPKQHTGEGIFFTSRIFDQFTIISRNLFFSGHKNADWVHEQEWSLKEGTAVFMKIRKDSTLKIQDVFNEYACGENDYGFTKTTIPVRLLRYEGEELVSRSQAKRLIARFDLFKNVILDFEGVKMIGQAFADEVFRIFKANNPDVCLTSINTTKEIDNMIEHVSASA